MNNGIMPTEGKVARYGGAGETAEVRAQTVREILRVQSGLLFEKPTERVHLNNVDELIDACKTYVGICLEKGLIPGFQGLATICGVSRNALYDFLRANPDTPSGIFLEKARTAFMATRQNAVDRGAAAESMSIFLMKNSFQQYADRVEIQPLEPKSPFDSLPDTELARKYLLECVPEDDDE